MEKICLHLCWIATIMVVINLTTATLTAEEPTEPTNKDCTGVKNKTTNQWDGCCTEENPCEIGEGDCDYHSQCTMLTMCGFDTCKSKWNITGIVDDLDCCENTEGCIRYLYNFDSNTIDPNDYGENEQSSGVTMRFCKKQCKDSEECKSFAYQISTKSCYLHWEPVPFPEHAEADSDTDWITANVACLDAKYDAVPQHPEYPPLVGQ